MYMDVGIYPWKVGQHGPPRLCWRHSRCLTWLCLQGDKSRQAVRFTVQLDGTGVPGRLAAEHLADSPQAVEELRAALRKGSRLGRLLVLERCEVRGRC